jgi:N-acetylglucosamine kinase-like BadF-type ATPase
MKEPTHLVVEGGGTGARALLESGDLVVRSRLEAGLNPNDVDRVTLGERLRSLVSPPVREAGLASGTVWAYLAIAGAGRPGMRERCGGAAVEVLEGLGLEPTVAVRSDLEALYETSGREAVVLIAGTGSSCMAPGGRGEGAVRVGGAGGRADRGSGVWLGLRALESALGETGGTSLLTRSVAGRACPDPGRLERLGAEGDRRTVAALARQVLETSRAGDSVAARLVRQACSDLVSMVETAAQKGGMTGGFDLVFSGGLFRSPDFLETFESEAVSRLPGVRLRPAPDHLDGLLAEARALARRRA